MNPIVFVKTPYNFNFWDVRNGVPADMTTIIAAIKRGYAWVGQNERGHFFSEGNYDILGAPITDGYETVDYLTKQPWSNGKLRKSPGDFLRRVHAKTGPRRQASVGRDGRMIPGEL